MLSKNGIYLPSLQLGTGKLNKLRYLIQWLWDKELVYFFLTNGKKIFKNLLDAPYFMIVFKDTHREKVPSN